MSELVTANLNWLDALQEKQRQAFFARGVPTRQEEQWKYTDFRSIAPLCCPFVEKRDVVPLVSPEKQISETMIVFINGIFSPEHSTLNLPAGVILCSLKDALTHHEALIKPHLATEFDAKQYPFAALNTAYLSEGMFLYVPKNQVLEIPIHCQFITTMHNSFYPRHILIADTNSQVTVIEEYNATQTQEYFINVMLQIHLHDNAQLDYYKIQDEGLQATHVATTMVKQNQDSMLKFFNLSRGAKIARDDVRVDLLESGAACYLHGLYLLNTDNQHVDHHLYVNHLAEHGTSSMMYKGILNKKSSAVFNGKVFVEKNAQKINAHQANHNLLLSKEAQINTKPELEIYADDVKCAHGATIGQLDNEALFYLRSRGIDKKTAEHLLVQAFAEEIIGQISPQNIRRYIKQRGNQYELS